MTQSDISTAPAGPPTWSAADKHGVGTAYAASSRVWYTIRHGYVTEVFYPCVDQPQIKDWRLMMADSHGRTDNEAGGFSAEIKRLCPSLGYAIHETPHSRAYAIDKTILADPHLPCVLQRVTLRRGCDGERPTIHTVLTPRLGNSGRYNDGQVMYASGRRILVAGRGERWLALGGERSFAEAAVRGDSETGIVLVGQVDVGDEGEFTLGLAFGHSCHAAITTLLQSLAEPFDEQADRFKQQWKRAVTDRRGLEHHACDGGNLYRASYSLILGHEDKTFPGATVASLSVPWGEAVTADEDEGGYHLIWTRDMVQTGTALLAAGQKKTPLRMLTYLAAAQRPDGSFIQCCWTDGTPYFDAVQLDEVAFPILLARRLHASEACDGFDPAYMVASAARYLLLHGPITQQERWEEAGGYSPSTLAAIIAASVCAAAFAAERGDFDAFDLLTDYADWLRAHVVDWTVTQFGSIVDKVPRHFVRLNPAKTGEPAEAGAVDHAIVRLSSQLPGARSEYAARDIVDAGFLELVRHGIFAADDPLIVDSLRVVDHALKRTTPLGDAWRRYSYDGYGQAADGAPYTGHGVGRAWPLLTGERGHYQLAAGGDVRPFVAAMERFAGVTGMLPEQVWDEADVPEARMYFGCPTGSAAPLIWAHAEYIKLLRSIDDGRPYDRFVEVAARYIDRQPSSACEFWTFAHPTPQIDAGRVLRLLTDRPFSLRYSCDGWATHQDQSSRVVYGVHVTDLLPADTCRTVAFTFHWADDDQWSGRNFEVAIRRQ